MAPLNRVEEALAELRLPICVFLIAVCGLVAMVWWRTCRGGGRRLPPGPPAWPVIGHLHLLGKLPHQALAELARRHAPHLMSLRLGSVPFLIASSPEAAKLILSTHDQIFASRPRTAASIHTTFNNSGIAYGPASPYWRRMRGICSLNLFSHSSIRSFQPMRRAEVGELLSSVFAQRQQLIQLRPMLQQASLSMISRMAIGRRLPADVGKQKKDTFSDVASLIEETVHLLGVFNVGDFVPFLAWLDLQGYTRRTKVVGRRFSAALQGLIDLRRATTIDDKTKLGGHHSQPPPPKDLLDMLLVLADINDENIKAVIGDIYLGGVDTTTAIVEWVIAELLSNPATFRTLHEELDKVVGTSRIVEEEDIQNLPYLLAVVKEALRLHPPGPLLIPHESFDSYEMHDYIIPPKTIALVNAWAIGRDPNVWESPLKFDPDRFLPKGRNNDMSPNGQYFQYLPFGSGRRRCPALSLALTHVHIMVASLAQAFHWEFASTVFKAPIDLSEKFGLAVSMASPLAIVPIPRVDSSLYIASL